MNVCIPVDEDQGLDSPVCAHFGSAPQFLVVDTTSGYHRAIPNASEQHGHGRCAPVSMLSGQAIDGVVVGGIGMGAVNKFAAAGIKVYRSSFTTVRETLSGLKAGTLPEVTVDIACGGRGHGRDGCGH